MPILPLFILFSLPAWGDMKTEIAKQCNAIKTEYEEVGAEIASLEETKQIVLSRSDNFYANKDQRAKRKIELQELVKDQTRRKGESFLDRDIRLQNYKNELEQLESSELEMLGILFALNNELLRSKDLEEKQRELLVNWKQLCD